MTNTIGDVKGVTGTSLNLNTQPGTGGMVPSAKAGTANPGDTKPSRVTENAVPMPK